MIKKLSELKPYKSLLLARVLNSVPVKDIVDNLLEDQKDLLSLAEDRPRTLISEEVKLWISARARAAGWFATLRKESVLGPKRFNRGVTKKAEGERLVFRGYVQSGGNQANADVGLVCKKIELLDV